jgi:hypothetical protein
VSSLTRPTISVFLFDVQENTEKRESDWQLVRRNGKAERRMPPRRIDLFYMVSALTADVDDEHELLWRVLATLMKYREFPEDVMPPSLKSLERVVTSRIAAQQESRQLLELWNALATKPHPALAYIVTTPLDLDVAIEAPLVLTRSARYYRIMDAKREGDVKPDVVAQIGGVVRSSNGQPVTGVIIQTNFSGEETKTNLAGQYMLRHVPQGPITLTVLRQDTVQKRLQVSVPAASYDIVLDE